MMAAAALRAALLSAAVEQHALARGGREGARLWCARAVLRGKAHVMGPTTLLRSSGRHKKCIVIDKRSGVGGLWMQDPRYVSVYDTVVVNSSKENQTIMNRDIHSP